MVEGLTEDVSTRSVMCDVIGMKSHLEVLLFLPRILDWCEWLLTGNIGASVSFSLEHNNNNQQNT